MFSKLDSLFDAPPEAPEPAAAPPEPSQAPAPTEKPAAAPAPEPQKAPAASDKAKSVVKPKTEGGALRENLEKANARVAEYEAKIKEYEAKGKDTEAITKRLAEIEKERDEAKRDLQMARMEKSPEFKEKWEKPFYIAAESSKDVIEQFYVDDNGVSRPADWKKDFGAIYALPYIAAKQRAKELFGEESAAVMQEYNKLHSMERASAKAWEEEKASYKQREQEQIANRAKEQEAYKAAWNATTEGWKKRYPDRYGESATDPKENEIFAKALEIVDAQPKTFQEAVAKNTRVRLDAAALPRVEYRLKNALKEIAELKAKLENGKASRPGSQKTPGAAAAAPADEDDGFSVDSIRKALGG